VGRIPFYHVQHLTRHLIPPEARHQINPLHLRLLHQLQQQLLGHLDPLAASLRTGTFHAGQRGFGDRDAGDLVVEETGVAVALQRQNAIQAPG